MAVFGLFFDFFDFGLTLRAKCFDFVSIGAGMPLIETPARPMPGGRRGGALGSSGRGAPIVLDG